MVAGVAVRVADATDQESADAAVTGQDAVIDTVGGKTLYRRTTLETDVARATIAAMQRHGVRRLIVVSSLGVGDSIANSTLLLKVLLISFLRGARHDKAAMENVVTGSDLEWVIVRPGVLSDASAIGKVRVFSANTRDRARTITRADLADFLVGQLSGSDHLRKAVTIANA